MWDLPLLFKFKLLNLFMPKWHSAEASQKRTIKDTPLKGNSINYIFTNFIQQKNFLITIYILWLPCPACRKPGSPQQEECGGVDTGVRGQPKCHGRISPSEGEMRPTITGFFPASCSASESVTWDFPPLPAWPRAVVFCVILFSVAQAAFTVENACIRL